MEGAGMADRVLFVGWGQAVRGLEERGLEVFNEALGLLGRMQQDGRIESFDTVLLEPNAELSGFVVIRGSADQIDGLRSDEDFRRNTLDASMIVDRLTHIEGVTNEGIASEMALYQEAISKVPQRA
jgi:hypothetical protein